MVKYLRFPDLKDRRVVNNRITLKNWIVNYGFPPGRLIGPNTRVWTEAEVDAWIARQPTAFKPGPFRSRKSAAEAADAT